MAAPLIFLNVSEQEQVDELAKHISQLKSEETEKKAYVEGIKALYEQKKIEEILEKFANESHSLLTLPPRELEGVYNLLINYIHKNKKDALINKFIEPFLTTELTGKPTYYLNVLGNIYNYLEVNSPVRPDVYVCILKFAAKTNKMNVILPSLENLDTWMDEWKVTLQKRREIYLLVREMLTKTGFQIEALNFLLKYLKSFDQTPGEVASAKDLSITAIVDAINLPTIFQFDEILSIKCIEQLKSHVIYNLLTIFANEGYKEYKALYTSKKDEISKLGLRHEDNMLKIRLITLATIGTESSDEIPYSKIAEALEVEQNELEKWIIDAIRFKLIEAKIDQMKQVIVISRTTLRNFNDPEWKQLKGSIDLWRDNVTQVLQVIENAKLFVSQHTIQTSQKE